MQTYVVIVAGGAGKRMGSVLPKQFLLLKNKPVLYYTINAFLKALPECKVIVVLPEEHLELGKEIVDGFFDAQRIQLTVGGETRFHSVQNGLKLVEEESMAGFDGGPTDETDATDEVDGAQLDDTISKVLTGSVNWGADEFGSVTGVKVGGSTIAIDGTTKTATAYFDVNGAVLPDATGAAATLVVDTVTGDYTLTVTGAMTHTGEGEDILTLADVQLTAVDGDGDPVSLALELGVKDDVPVNLTEDPKDPDSVALKLTNVVEEESISDGKGGVIGNDERGFQRLVVERTPAGFVSRIERGELQASPRLASGQIGMLAFVDLDDFKRINDTWGHPAGDAMLRHVAQTSVQSVRSTDLVGRLGGEEFIVLLPHTHADAGRRIAEKIRQRLEASPLQWKGETLHITASFGLSSTTAAEGRSFDHLYNEADKALYLAKQRGRNRVI